MKIIYIHYFSFIHLWLTFRMMLQIGCCKGSCDTGKYTQAVAHSFYFLSLSVEKRECWIL